MLAAPLTLSTLPSASGGHPTRRGTTAERLEGSGGGEGGIPACAWRMGVGGAVNLVRPKRIKLCPRTLIFAIETVVCR